ncbi:MAG: hypothetical protein HRT69_16885 [Flavobacteriaceae bacterium]|nr:hypothetical protein [Flavobacteriaceae bacterium]
MEKKHKVHVFDKEPTIMISQVDCSILNNIDSTTAIIVNNNAKLIINNSVDDNCILRYVDSISKRFIKSPNKMYFKALERVYDISDGYLSEYMAMVSYQQFEENFEVFYGFYITENNIKMKNFIFDGIIAHIEFSDEKMKTKLEIIRLCNSYKLIYKENELLDDLLILLKGNGIEGHGAD